jgi:hypothetical protein
MTKFMTLSKPIDPEAKTKITLFNNLIMYDGTLGTNHNRPSDFKNVLFLGHSNCYAKDLFMAWDNNREDFVLYLGVKGDEFKD